MKITFDLPNNAQAIVMTTLYNEHDGSVTLSTKSVFPADGDVIKIVKDGTDYREENTDGKT